uniref:Uncharacterized protein n=1 Tax=Arundo donax TaxID=35708 RepID=A0A0A9HU06_ARUDO
MPPCWSTFSSTRARCRIKMTVFRALHELMKNLMSAVCCSAPSNPTISISFRQVC